MPCRKKETEIAANYQKAKGESLARDSLLFYVSRPEAGRQYKDYFRDTLKKQGARELSVTTQWPLNWPLRRSAVLPEQVEGKNYTVS